MTTPRSPVEYHEQLAGDWGAKYAKKSFEKRLHAFARHLPADLSGQSWLDAGCGTGVMSALLASRGATVLGVDGSAAMIDKAQETCAGGARCRFVVIDDLDSWTPDTGRFDGILCSSVIEYLGNPRRLVECFHRHLEPSGILVASVPNRRSLLRAAQKTVYGLNRLLGRAAYPNYLQFSKNDYTRRDFAALLGEAGFVVLRADYFGVPKLPARWDGPVTSPLMLFSARPSPRAPLAR